MRWPCVRSKRDGGSFEDPAVQRHSMPRATLKKHLFSWRHLATISEYGMEGSKRPILEPAGRAWRVFQPAFRLYRRTCAMSRFRLMKMLASASAVNARVAFLASPR